MSRFSTEVFSNLSDTEKTAMEELLGHGGGGGLMLMPGERAMIMEQEEELRRVERARRQEDEAKLAQFRVQSARRGQAAAAAASSVPISAGFVATGKQKKIDTSLLLPSVSKLIAKKRKVDNDVPVSSKPEGNSIETTSIDKSPDVDAISPQSGIVSISAANTKGKAIDVLPLSSSLFAYGSDEETE
jgi:hypothetical protein